MIDTLLDYAVIWVPVLTAGAGAGFWAGYAIGRRAARQVPDTWLIAAHERQRGEIYEEKVRTSVKAYLGR